MNMDYSPDYRSSDWTLLVFMAIVVTVLVLIIKFDALLWFI